ncbi:hypothetical protein BBK14_26350 [Parafrankia soli]|uniref:DUF3558 domain-containing protein n=2 Tax=Parafrankia soli TaxID=2599596 RepID=A0A1S1PNR0_9ACTN|nr:hypothetical protein BBK14_26350 [Parafrankia soli]
MARLMLVLGAVLVSCMATTSCGPASDGPGSGPVPPCSLLTVPEIRAAIDAAWSPGRQQVSEGDTDAIGCAFSSPKGFVILWSSAQDAEAGYRSSRAAPTQQPQQDLSGVGYEGYAYTSPGNVQEVHLLKGDAYVSVAVGAGAPPGTARHFGDLVVAGLP